FPGIRVASSVPVTRTGLPGPRTTDDERRSLEPSSALPSTGEAAGEAHAAPAYRIVAPNLARPYGFHKTKPLPLPPDPPRPHRRILPEEWQPALRLGPAAQRAPRSARRGRA